MSVVSTINNTENYGEHRSWIDVDGGRYGDRLCHSPHRYLSKQVPYYCCQQSGPQKKKKKAPAVAPTADTGAMDAIKAAVEILTAGKGQVIKIEKL